MHKKDIKTSQEYFLITNNRLNSKEHFLECVSGVRFLGEFLDKSAIFAARQTDGRTDRRTDRPTDRHDDIFQKWRFFFSWTKNVVFNLVFRKNVFFLVFSKPYFNLDNILQHLTRVFLGQKRGSGWIAFLETPGLNMRLGGSKWTRVC